ncbi:CLUMA_CG016660, isoform A [Clunio marinus]|uniref:CLUMA_CG016660, isoform A n=1 Tax=Clunio marinus TaxID=568069 RepID=A0A1J1IVW7_9DIPT|nr:CLUMA_CG016660, isoform A [Clunio marinus]
MFSKLHKNEKRIFSCVSIPFYGMNLNRILNHLKTGNGSKIRIKKGKSHEMLKIQLLPTFHNASVIPRVNSGFVEFKHLSGWKELAGSLSRNVLILYPHNTNGSINNFYLIALNCLALET